MQDQSFIDTSQLCKLQGEYETELGKLLQRHRNREYKKALKRTEVPGEPAVNHGNITIRQRKEKH